MSLHPHPGRSNVGHRSPMPRRVHPPLVHQELIQTNYGPQTNSALQNFKTLLNLDISLLMMLVPLWGLGALNMLLMGCESCYIE